MDITKETYMSADPETEKGFTYDMLKAMHDSIKELVKNEKTRDDRAMRQGAKFGMFGGFSAVCTIASLNHLIKYLIG